MIFVSGRDFYFWEIIRKMVDDGIDVFIEAGPKTVLKGMMRKIIPKNSDEFVIAITKPTGCSFF